MSRPCAKRSRSSAVSLPSCTDFALNARKLHATLRIGHLVSPHVFEESRLNSRDLIREFVGALEERVELASTTPYIAKKSAEKAVTFLQDAIEHLIVHNFNLDVLVSRAAEVAQERMEEKAEMAAPALNPSPGYEAALDAEAVARTRMFEGAAMPSSEQIAELLGVSRETVNTHRRAASCSD